ncbi:MAG: T9SS type A sorting domain-containing protein, partial [Bacteroidales bacterium]|nr:T9SS type A sorting domain-containing protein [Bacteroidales bacterium]
ETNSIVIDTTICKSCTFTYNNVDYTKDAVIIDTLRGSAGSDSVYVTINLTVELAVGDENITAATCKVYPNPSDGMINVEVAEPSLVEIFTVSGVRVAKRQVANTAKFSLQKGVYMLHVTNSSSGTYTEKVIVK